MSLGGLALVILLHLDKQRDRISSPLSLLKLSRQSNHSSEGPERVPGNTPKAFSPVPLGNNPKKKKKKDPKRGVGVCCGGHRLHPTTKRNHLHSGKLRDPRVTKVMTILGGVSSGSLLNF